MMKHIRQSLSLFHRSANYHYAFQAQASEQTRNSFWVADYFYRYSNQESEQESWERVLFH